MGKGGAADRVKRLRVRLGLKGGREEEEEQKEVPSLSTHHNGPSSSSPTPPLPPSNNTQHLHHQQLHPQLHHHPHLPRSRPPPINSSTRSISALSSACSSGASEGDSLDTHLMQSIKQSKFRRGPKFIFFNDERFQRELLETHNEVRQRHGAPPLLWAAPLADMATDWATKLLQSDRGRMLYLDVPGTGENIRLSKASESNHLPTGAEISTAWAAESRHFDFTKPRWRTGCEHFTQMIWRESQEMGASRVWAPNKNLVAIVVLYRPGGNNNVPGAFAHNVLAPGTPLEGGVGTGGRRNSLTSSSQSTPRHLGPRPFASTPAHLLLRNRRPFTAASAASSPAPSVAGSCPGRAGLAGSRGLASLSLSSEPPTLPTLIPTQDGPESLG